MGFNLAAKMALWPIGKILWQVDQSELLKFFQSSSDFFFHRPSLFFYYLEKKKKSFPFVQLSDSAYAFTTIPFTVP